MDKKQKELQEKYTEFQILNLQLQEIQKQMQNLDQQNIELEMTKQELDEFNKIKKGTDVLVSIEPGIFARAKLEDNENMLVNVGSGVVVDKNMKETKKLLEKQQDEINNLKNQLNLQVQQLLMKISLLKQDLERMV